MSCLSCGHSVDGNFLARHLCSGCGNPQSVGADETFFNAFGVGEKFGQDLSLLQKRFYEISRALHPDRFTTAGADVRQLSLQRMSFVNDAYRTLKDRALLRDYILELHGFKGEGARGQVPMELAESWFELQESLADNPAEAASKIAAFKAELQSFRESTEASIQESEKRLDEIDPLSAEYREGLAQLARLVQQVNYHKSLARDVERLAAQ